MKKKYSVYYKNSSTKFEHTLEKLANFIQSIYDTFWNKPFIKNKSRKVSIQVSAQDTWAAYRTLSLVIVAVLRKYREDNKYSMGFAYNVDLPENLRSKDGEDGHYNTEAFFYIVDEMIWAFDQIATEKSDDLNKAGQERLDNGLRLFAKYFQTLWS